MAKINETLRQLRQERGLTQEEVAERVGLTRQAVSGYEAGRTQPGLDVLQRLADIYQVELTDIIYGRAGTDRMRRALKITALVLAVVVLAAQLAEALLLWTANHFFAIEPGVLSDADMLIWKTRVRLTGIREDVGSITYGLFPLCCMALLVLSLFLRRPLPAKTKLLCALGFALASAVVVLPWALTDPVFPPVNYLTTPGLCLAQLLFFLLLSLLIDFLRGRRRKRAGEV
ncbi:MAG: helix-turn-helix transcriptional regulator [Oscillospiraceae bacterium]